VGGVWKDIWTSLKAVVAATAAAVALGLALLGSLWDPGKTVQIGLIWLAVMVFVMIAVIAAAARMVSDARQTARGDPPRAIYVASPAADGPIVLIMSRSRQFGVNIFVTIYYEEILGAGRRELFERTIGIGRVINVQENGLIQVQVLREVVNQSGLWQRIRSCEMAILSHVIIKPSIDFNAVGIEVRLDE
jgi:hypothetical protein